MAWECFPGVFLQGCCLPGRGEVGHTINLQAIAYSCFFLHWSCIFLKNFSTPSVGERLLRGRRNYRNIFLSFSALETDSPPPRFVAE